MDCIIGADEDRMLFIDPQECIDCGACVDPCPVDAIYAEEDLPPEWTEWTAINKLYFASADEARTQVNAKTPEVAQPG